MSRGPGKRFQELRALLDRTLFPESPPPRPTGPRGVAILIALLTVGVALQILRLGWTASLNTLWAEDGPIFLQEAIGQGLGHSLVDTYAGYLVVTPRLIGEAAALAPLEHAPAAITLLSAGVVALSGLAVWFAAAGHVRDPYLRGSLAILTVLVPVAGLESIDSAAYVPWYMLFATFWLLLWRPRSAVAATLASIFILAAALSTPGVWFFLPLAALRAVAIRDRRDAVIVGGYGLGSAAQIPAYLLNNEEAVDPAWTADIWTAYAQRVVDGAALGQQLGGSAWAHLGWPFLILLVLGAGMALAAGLAGANGRTRLLAAIAIPTSLGLFVVSAYQRAVGSDLMWPAGGYGGAAGRYAIVPVLLLVSVAVVLIEDIGAKGRERLFRGARFLASAVLLVGVATSFDMADPGVRGEPLWDNALRGAADACVVEGTADATIATSPPGFGMSLPCEKIDSFAGPATEAREPQAEEVAFPGPDRDGPARDGSRTYPGRGVPLGRFRTKRGGHGADSAWQRHVGSATGPNPRRSWAVSRGATSLPG